MREIREGEDIEESEKMKIIREITPVEISEHIRKYDEFLQESKIENDETSSEAEYESTKRAIREYIDAEEKSEELIDEIISSISQEPLKTDNLEIDHIKIRDGSREIRFDAPHIREKETKECNESIEESKVEKETNNLSLTEIKNSFHEINPRSEFSEAVVQSYFVEKITEYVLGESNNPTVLNARSMKYAMLDVFLSFLSESALSFNGSEEKSISEHMAAFTLFNGVKGSKLLFQSLTDYSEIERFNRIQEAVLKKPNPTLVIDLSTSFKPDGGYDRLIDTVVDNIYAKNEDDMWSKSNFSDTERIMELKSRAIEPIHSLVSDSLTWAKKHLESSHCTLHLMIAAGIETTVWVEKKEQGHLKQFTNHGGGKAGGGGGRKGTDRSPKLGQSWTLMSLTDVRFLLHRGLHLAISD